MLELAVTTLDVDQIPALILNEFDHFFNFHAVRQLPTSFIPLNYLPANITQNPNHAIFVFKMRRCLFRVTDGQSVRVSKKGRADNQPDTDKVVPVVDGMVVVASGAR